MREMAGHSVLIVAATGKAKDYLTEVLPPNEFSSVLSVTNVGEARRLLLDRSFDLVLVNTPLPDDFGIRFAVDIAKQSNAGILLLVKAELLDAASEKTESLGILTVGKPASRQVIFQSIRLLLATQNRIRALEEKTISLQAKMEEIRLINRAKLLLIEHLKMSEPEAHRYIEKQAMDNCVKRKQIAENIIKTYDY